jgi:8-oxo-dGTP pyrophosphatase MutT (NUDIX family)
MNPNASTEVSLKIILRNKKGEVLLLKNPDSSSLAGSFDLPGGRIHQAEMKAPLAKAFAREVREELGSKVKYDLKEVPVAIGRHWYDSRSKKERQYIFWLLFEGIYRGGEIKLSEEHEEYRWVKLTKANYRKYFVRGALEGMENYFFKKFSKDKMRG